MSANELRRILTTPSAVAIVGASDEAGKIAARPLQFLRQHGYGGKVYPVARRDTVMGEKAYQHIKDVPEPIDHAFIALPTAHAIEAAHDCAHAGVKLITILADGFAEAGAEGLERQRDLLRLIDKTGCRLLGPNSLGMVRTANALSMTANAAFAVDRLVTGRTTVLSQSGSLVGTLYSRGRARGIGFSNLISVGNEADLSIGELGEALVDDPETDAFLLFLETIRHRDKLERFARAAAHAGKPIVAYKLGRSQLGAELAVSHTGALVGSDAAADQFLRELGIVRVDMFEALLEAGPLLRSVVQHQKRPKAATVITTTGGGGALVADRLATLGVDVRGASSDAIARLAAKGIAIKPGHIIDLTLAGTRYEIMRGIVDELLQADDIGALVAVIGSTAEFFPDRVVAPIVDAFKAAKPGHPALAVFVTPDGGGALSMLAEAGIAGFRTPESCADSVNAALSLSAPRNRPTLSIKPAAAAMLDQAPERMNEREALSLFEAIGIPGPRQTVVAPNDVRSLQLSELPPFPVVAKLLSRDLPHKSDIGAIALGLNSVEDIAAAVDRMVSSARAKAPGATIEGILLQQQYSAIGEVLIGYRYDPGAGPVVSIGLGGTQAELHRDFALRLAPVSRDEAMAMIHEVPSLAALRGYRGKPLGDLDALADAVVNISTLALHSRVREAEINPLLVSETGHGVVAVDGLIVNAPAQR